eukprot:jgi/Mesvir1/7364/Mv19167-RA.1
MGSKALLSFAVCFILTTGSLGDEGGEGHCSMYGVCGAREDGKPLNCPDSRKAVVPDEAFSRQVQGLCPRLTGALCCTEEQFANLRNSVKKAATFLVGCPACNRNFMDLWCAMSCSPDQALFVNITNTIEAPDTKATAVDALDYFLSGDVGPSLFASCKDVKFAAMNTRALDFVGGGAQSWKEWASFMGAKRPLGEEGSPYTINFPDEADLPEGSGIRPLDLDMHTCGDPSLTCSCGDCPSAPGCAPGPGPGPLPVAGGGGFCTVRVWGVEMLCVTLACACIFAAFTLAVLLVYARVLPSKLGRAPLVEPLVPSRAHKSESFWREAEDVVGPLDRDRNDVSTRAPLLHQDTWRYGHDDAREDDATPPAASLLSREQTLVSNGDFGERCNLKLLFRDLGIFIARRPILVAVTMLAFVGLASCGLFFFQVDTDPNKLWVNPSWATAKDKAFYENHFGRFYRIEQLILSTSRTTDEHGHRSPAPSILQDKYLRLLFEFQAKVDALAVSLPNVSSEGGMGEPDNLSSHRDDEADGQGYAGAPTRLSDICYKPLGDACATQSVLQYFQMDPDRLDDYGGADHVAFCAAHPSSSQECLAAYGAPLEPRTVLGGLPSTALTNATSFVVTYPVVNRENSTEMAVTQAWEAAFIELARGELTALARQHNLTLAFSSESSVEAELSRESGMDIPVAAISYALMLVYVAVALSDAPPPSVRLGDLVQWAVSSRVLLASAGVSLVLLSVTGAVGLCSALGVHSTLIIAEVIPFLTLAVGVDNMCILTHALKRQDDSLPLDIRVGKVLSECAPSISLASAAEVTAFALGTLTDVPAVKVFSLLAAVAVALDYLLQITVFIAFLSLDQRRVEDHRADCLPCVPVIRPYDYDATDLGVQKRRREERTNPRSPLALYMQRVHAPMLASRGAKAVVLVVFVGAALFSASRLPLLRVGLEQRVALPQDSYLQNYFKTISSQLRVGPPLFLMVSRLNVTTDVNKVCSVGGCGPHSLLNEVAAAARVPQESHIATPAASWLDDFLSWISPDAFGCCRRFPDGSYCPPDDQPPCSQPDDAWSASTSTQPASPGDHSWAPLAGALPSDHNGQASAARQRRHLLQDADASNQADMDDPAGRHYGNGTASSLRSDGMTSSQGTRNTLVTPAPSGFPSSAAIRPTDPGSLSRGTGHAMEASATQGGPREDGGADNDDDGPCDACTMCFTSEELDHGRPNVAQFADMLPVFLHARPSADCAKGGLGAYGDSVRHKGLHNNGVIGASSFRAYHTALRSQEDFIEALRFVRNFVAEQSRLLGLRLHAYSVFHPYFEQYLEIRTEALVNLSLALASIFLITTLFTHSPWGALLTTGTIGLVLLDLAGGALYLLGVELNAVSMVNLVMAVGISVEFCAHIAHAFALAAGTREARARKAVAEMGASVLSGITLTKVVGVGVLAFARTQIFVVYYFRMYAALVVLGAAHGLVFLPVLLSLCGPEEPPALVELDETGSEGEGGGCGTAKGAEGDGAFGAGVGVRVGGEGAGPGRGGGSDRALASSRARKAALLSGVVIAETGPPEEGGKPGGVNKKGGHAGKGKGKGKAAAVVPRRWGVPEEEQEYCLNCVDGPRECRIQPCGHVCVCMPCAQQLLAEFRGCPQCRTAIADAIHIRTPQ